MIRYHDQEWGVPLHDDRLLFEFLILEGAQAGLSWNTILSKRENYRLAFDNFEASVIADYGDDKTNNLLMDAGIVRNRMKVSAAVTNAQAFLRVVEEEGSFDNYIWSFVGARTRNGFWESMSEVPSKTVESDSMSKDLKAKGFKFVGSTICYAFMQAAGLVNDHKVGCFRHGQI